jgi:hypothetical protein
MGGIIRGSARLPVIAFHMQTGCTLSGLNNERPNHPMAAENE